jgi:hypothetical protein
MKATTREYRVLGLNERIERWVDLRTSGRVRGLSVEKIGDRVIVRGRTETHYVRQLALAAVQQALEALPQEPLEVQLEIDVISS